MNTKRDYKRIIIYFLFFCVFFYLAYQAPYCHDEWQWGLDERIELMKNGFRNYNGRYLGNILALIITRSVWAKALILSGCSLWLFYLINRSILPARIDENGSAATSPSPASDVFFMVFAAFLLLSVPRTLFAQSYGWPAAFVNFVPPVILFLIYYNWTEPIYSHGLPQFSKFQVAMAVILGISVQLFSEHITVFVVLYAAWLVLFIWIKTKKISLLPLIYFLSSAAGALIMFSNAAYRRAATDTEGYKRISLSIGSMIRQFYTEISDHLFLNNWILNVLLAGVLIYLIARKNMRSLLSMEMLLVMCGYSVYSVFHKIYPAWVFTGNENINNLVEAFLSLLFFANVLLCIWFCIEVNEKYSVCILYLCAAFVSAPLVAANPIGPRCFYISYVFQVLVLLKITGYLAKQLKTDLYFPALVLVFVTIVLSVCYVKMFKNIGQVNRLRLEIIETSVAAGETEITLPMLPYSEYYWTTIPVDKTWEKRFKKFYHIPLKTKIKFE